VEVEGPSPGTWPGSPLQLHAQTVRVRGRHDSTHATEPLFFSMTVPPALSRRNGAGHDAPAHARVASTWPVHGGSMETAAPRIRAQYPFSSSERRLVNAPASRGTMFSKGSGDMCFRGHSAGRATDVEIMTLPFGSGSRGEGRGFDKMPCVTAVQPGNGQRRRLCLFVRPRYNPRALVARALWGCVVSTGAGDRRTRAEVPSGLVKQAANEVTGNSQPALALAA